MRELLIPRSIVGNVAPKANKAGQAKIVDSLAKTRIPHTFSLELCPNRGVNAALMEALAPPFVSATWLDAGANGALLLCAQLVESGRNVLLHLAGRSLAEAEAFCVLDNARRIGIRNVLALRGDARCRVNDRDDKVGDFPHANDLVRYIRRVFGAYFCVAVAGYPEKHPEAEDMARDLKNLKRKVSSGADFIITQGSFDPEAVEAFCKSCNRNADITCPIIPGIFVISSTGMLKSIAKLCKVPVPEHVNNTVMKNEKNSESVREYGIHLAAETIRKLIGNGHKIVHIFTLNNLEVVHAVEKRVWGSFFYLESAFIRLERRKEREITALTSSFN